MVLKIIKSTFWELFAIANDLTIPKKIHREVEEQEKLDKVASNMVLYQYYSCPYCVKIRRIIHRLNVRIELRDIRKNESYRKELEDKGGKLQVPCLRINNKENLIWLYESNEIKRFLYNNFTR